MEILPALLLMTACLAMEAFFSGSEIGIVSADPIRLRVAAAQGSRGARLALKMLERPEWLLATTLVGTNIAVVTNTTIATALAIELFGEGSSWVAVVVVAPLIWVFGEIVPKSVFQQRADAYTLRAIYGLYAASFVFWPILVVFSALTTLLTRLVGGTRSNLFRLRDELRTMLQMSPTEGDIQPAEQDMIRRLFDFGETTAEEVMQPWLEVTAIPEEALCGDAIELAMKTGHKRFPVYRDRVDRVVGELDTFDLIGREPAEPIQAIVRPVDFVPEARRIKDLLLDLRIGTPHLSVVVDEVGGAIGIVTVRDIVQEVVETVEDEFDVSREEQPDIQKLDERDYLVSARVEMDDLEEALELEIPHGSYVTLAGYLLERIRDIPVEGETVTFDDISFTIQRATPRAIDVVRIRWEE
ncbi:MAG: hemolysin family protein [Planctomycetota bacterium]|nr:hemolysin family protein [Planctomycetota bacterium]